MLRLLLGGTFDPVHEGHLALARHAAAAFGSCVWLLPSGIPPHRPPPHADAVHRAAMVRAAIADEPMLALDTRELEREGASYTVETLTAMREQLGGELPIGLLLGADAFLGLPGWHCWERIPTLAHLVVVTRPGSRLDVLPAALAAACRTRWTGRRERLHRQPAGLVHQLEFPPHPASATAVRASLARGQAASQLPAAVARYIEAHGLYRQAPDGAG